MSRPAALACGAALAIVACGGSETGTGGPAPADSARARDDASVEELRRFESDRRASADFGRAPPSDRLFGPDPYVVRSLGDGRFVGLLRGADALVLLDGDLRELARASAPASPSGLAVSGDTAFVVGENEDGVLAVPVLAGGFGPARSIPLAGVRAARDVAAGPGGVLHVVEEASGTLFTLVPASDPAGGHEVHALNVGPDAFRVARTKSAVIVASLSAHTVSAYRVDAQGRPIGPPAVIRNDGPLWSFAAREDDAGLVVASGGVEDRPLDRTHGSFENIDSFVYLDRLTWEPAPRAARLAEINVSEHGVIVPKALDIEPDAAGFHITATGFGGDALASIRVPEGGAPPSVTTLPLPPGTASFTRDARGDLVIANPLLDAWVRSRADDPSPVLVPVPDPRRGERTPASRLGEALIFTTLIAPWNRSAGPLSRFTCETCHFEGHVDGRTHATGRGDVRATTRPLLGLFNNRPHFSRALDPDLSIVAHSEFRVAGARSGHDPVFDLTLKDAPWLAGFGVTDADLSAVPLRRAFMTFLMEWSPRTSPLTAGQSAFTDVEQRGAELFRSRCEGCHEARLASDKPATRVPFDSWAQYVFSPASPIVWGQPRRAKTGPAPYVHDEGARVPSLRRLHKKRPYFTTGAAKTLADLLARARWDGERFFHDAAPPDPALRALTAGERLALEAFLRLL